MHHNRFLLIPVILLVSACFAFGQDQKKLTDADYASYPHWMTMVKDPHGNFLETQKAFYLYWKDREIPKEGSGYKLFKRWEYQMRSVINPDGSYPEPGHVYKEFNNFVKSHPQADKLKSGQNEWKEFGPRLRAESNKYVGMGRLNAIAFHPSDPEIIYVGAPTGGLWITRDGGDTWSTTTDDQPFCGVSAILVDPVNPDIILIGTGDRDRDYMPIGMGVFRSEDGGLSWMPSNSGMGNVNVGMFARSADNRQIILAAANGGLFKTVDGGKEWLPTSPHSANFTDIRFKPGSSTVAYATSPKGFYRTENAGDTWILVPANSGYLVGSRMVIGVTPANDSLVYLISGQEYPDKFLGCFLSRDFGHSFVLQSSYPDILGYALDGSTHPNQVGYDLCIHVDSDNPQILRVGAIRIWKSINGGKSWTFTYSEDEIHADQHVLTANPLNNRLYIGNDGGIFYRDKNGSQWNNISNGLGIGQIYKIGVNVNERSTALAGFQDNCSAVWNGRDWSTVGSGDGTECFFDLEDSRYMYVSYQQGTVLQLFNNVLLRTIAKPDLYGIHESGLWITPYILSKGDPNTMIVGYENIWINRDIRRMGIPSWDRISDNLPGSTYSWVAALEQSPADLNVLYATYFNGRLTRTDNLLEKEVAWTVLSPTLPVTGYQPYLDIECHPFDANVVYFVNNKKVLKSTNKGFSVQDITGSLPDISLNTIVYDKTSNEGLYVGSDAGVYYKDADMTDWVLYGTALPVSVKVTELEIFYDSVNRSGSRIYASTYGRGLWETGLAIIQPVPAFQLSASVSGESVELKWSPPYYKQNIQGYRVYRNGVPIGTTTEFTFTDLNAEIDVTQYYNVTVLYPEGAESGFSNQVFATVITPVTLPYAQTFEKGTGAWSAKFSVEGWKHGDSEQLGITGRDGKFFGISSVAAGADLHVADYLMTPKIDLSPYLGRTVTLKFAYTFRKYRNYDKLSVMYRTLPDSTWKKTKDLDATDLSYWIWDTTSLDLPVESLSGQTQIGFFYDDLNKFGWGAGIDDVELFVNTTSVENVQNINALRVFPNPSDGKVTLELTSDLPDEVHLRVYATTGQLLLNKIIHCQPGVTTESIDLSAQSKGVFLLDIKSVNGSWHQQKTIMLQPENVKRH